MDMVTVRHTGCHDTLINVDAHVLSPPVKNEMTKEVISSFSCDGLWLCELQ